MDWLKVKISDRQKNVEDVTSVTKKMNAGTSKTTNEYLIYESNIYQSPYLSYVLVFSMCI